ncbi:hypothetical protein RHOSPDRAFT_27889 [Rhodotorula sp. JG-1b]|nr:hypothetical protein RHOSPDRAFT_27889 [Rhodotorula sp. JG-1b]
MFGSTFLAGCSVILRTLEGLLAPSATSATPSTPARGFYQCSPTSNQAYSVSAPSTAISVVEKEEEDDSLECPPSPPVSDSSSVCSQSSSDLFNSDSDDDAEDQPDTRLPIRSRAFAFKVAFLDFWLEHSRLASMDSAEVRAFGIRMIESEDIYEIQYEQSQLNLDSAKLVEREDVRNERLMHRLARALDDFVKQRPQAARLARLREAARSLPLDFVARPYAWPAQWHSRALSSVLSVDAAVDIFDLSRARSDLRRSSSSSRRRISTPSKRPARSKGKSKSLLRKTLDCGVRPAYRAHKCREQQALAPARIASISQPMDCSARACSGPAPEVPRRGPQKLAAIPLENATSTTPSTPSGLGKPPMLATLAAAPRSRIPIPIAKPIKPATLQSPTPVPSGAGPARQAQKSYGEIEPRRRPPFRV